MNSHIGLPGFIGSLVLAAGCLFVHPHGAQAANLKNDVLEDLVNEAVSNVKQGQLPQAVRALNKCVRTDKTYAPCHRILGLVYTKTGKNGDDRRAANEMREYLKLNPKAPDAAALRDLIKEYDSRS